MPGASADPLAGRAARRRFAARGERSAGSTQPVAQVEQGDLCGRHLARDFVHGDRGKVTVRAQSAFAACT